MRSSPSSPRPSSSPSTCRGRLVRRAPDRRIGVFLVGAGLFGVLFVFAAADVSRIVASLIALWWGDSWRLAAIATIGLVVLAVIGDALGAVAWLRLARLIVFGVVLVVLLVLTRGLCVPQQPAARGAVSGRSGGQPPGRGRDARAATAPGSRLRVVLGVRADFYGRCAEYRELVDTLRDSQVLVGMMLPAELRAAINEPARRVGLTVETTLVSTIISEMLGRPGALPLMSHALVETGAATAAPPSPWPATKPAGASTAPSSRPRKRCTKS